MQSLGYVPPEAPEGAEVVDLMKSSTRGLVREPGEFERVLCINRGTIPVRDQFDSREIVLPPTQHFTDGTVKPGLFYLEYAAARHIQRRQIVPGTKNLATSRYISYVGILNVDPPELCEPFTEKQMAEYGERYEAIDRSEDYGFGREVQVRGTAQVRAASPTLGARPARALDTSQQASEAAAAAVAPTVVGEHVNEDGSVTPVIKPAVLAGGRRRRGGSAGVLEIE